MSGAGEDPALAPARAAAQAFVREEAGFAQVTTIDRDGFPVGRTMTAFLAPDWSVALVQRRVHARLAQLRRDPHVLVTWVGSPAPGATNERPHVFDLDLLPPRVVLVRGTAVFMPHAWTLEHYLRAVTAQRAAGHTRAPLRTPEQVAADLVGVLVRPHRVRLEGFADGPRPLDWQVGPPSDLGPDGNGAP